MLRGRACLSAPARPAEMGSSELSSQSLTLAVLFGLLFLLFDALRFFIVQMGPVRYRRWSGETGERRGASSSHPHHVTMVIGSVVQLLLIAACVFTASHLAPQGMGVAATKTVVGWAAIIIFWKFILALMPEIVAEWTVRALIPVTRALYFVFWPLVYPLERLHARAEARAEEEEADEVTDEEVQAYIDVGEQEGILEEGEAKLVQSIVDFGDRIAKEIMTPRIDMEAFEVSGTLQDLARVFNESKYSRIPVYEQSIDSIIGIVHVKDVFDAYLHNPSAPVRALLRQVNFISETKKVPDLLREFQLEHLQVAVVVDEYGGTAGLISIEDIVEEIVGEIADEHEEMEEEIIEVGEDSYLVAGGYRVEELEEKLGVEFGGEGYETVAGLIFTTVGRVPTPGETIRRKGLIFEVERVDRRRIYRVKVSRDPHWEPHEEQRA